MLSKERVMVMARLAMLEDEYGQQIKESIPKRKKYVNGRMLMFFIWESLLYLLGCVILFVMIFLLSAFSLQQSAMNTLIAIVVAIYVAVTVLGLVLLKHSSERNYVRMKKQRALYLRELEKLISLYNDERENV